MPEFEQIKAPSLQPQTDSSPSLKVETARCAKVLLGCYRTGDANDPEIYVRAVTAVLGDYPMDVVHSVCDPRHGIPSKSQWLPTVAEVKQACEVEMAPVYRREREVRLEEERKKHITIPTGPRLTLDDLHARHGDKWGLNPQGMDRPAPRSLDDMCSDAGISREDFEAVNSKAVEALRRSGR